MEVAVTESRHYSSNFIVPTEIRTQHLQNRNLQLYIYPNRSVICIWFFQLRVSFVFVTFDKKFLRKQLKCWPRKLPLIFTNHSHLHVQLLYETIRKTSLNIQRRNRPRSIFKSLSSHNGNCQRCCLWSCHTMQPGSCRHLGGLCCVQSQGRNIFLYHEDGGCAFLETSINIYHTIQRHYS